MSVIALVKITLVLSSSRFLVLLVEDEVERGRTEDRQKKKKKKDFYCSGLSAEILLGKRVHLIELHSKDKKKDVQADNILIIKSPTHQIQRKNKIKND